MRLDPTEFGLHARTVIKQLDGNTIALVIDRKSRIIMADGKKILEKSSKIETVQPQLKIALKITAPICSKTRIFLENQGIRVIIKKKYKTT